MKKIIVVAVAAVALASATAYAQMQHRQPPGEQTHMQCPMEGMTQCPMHGMMQGMQGKMHGKMQGKVQHSPMHGGQGTPSGHDQHSSAGPRGDTGPSSLAFYGINAKMHEGMNITFSGNADVDFVNGMIPHHQGAVDMAKVLLAFGKDPELRKLADAIIKAQESEIAFMNAWLERNNQ
jgi:hypothetical protein